MVSVNIKQAGIYLWGFETILVFVFILIDFFF
jgi:hypothetical protein